MQWRSQPGYSDWIKPNSPGREVKSMHDRRKYLFYYRGAYVAVVLYMSCLLICLLFFQNMDYFNGRFFYQTRAIEGKPWLPDFLRSTYSEYTAQNPPTNITQPTKDSNPLPMIYAITPTYARWMQKAELTRVSQTFLHVASFHWIVIEDSPNKTDLVANFLNTSGLSYTHLYTPTPKGVKNMKGRKQRNLAMDWLVNHTRKEDPGELYFADDDNTYDIRIFEEMRYTKIVSVWPVGLVGGARYERPIVNNKTGHVTGWDVAKWGSGRPFAIDMAGFAISLRRLHERPHVRFRAEKKHMETDLLERLVTMDELEPKADACTKVYVWHSQTKTPPFSQPGKNVVANIEV